MEPAVVQIDASGQPAARGILLSAADKPKDSVKEPPGLASTDDGRLGIVFTFVDGMRSQMRSIKTDCLSP
jgi:hypothetical protein